MMISENSSLLPYNTFGIQALARVLVTYDSADELRQALSLYRSQYAGLPLLHIGAGSNLLFLSDYPGMVLHSQVGGVTLLGSEGDDVLVRVGAGLEHDEWVARAGEPLSHPRTSGRIGGTEYRCLWRGSAGRDRVCRGCGTRHRPFLHMDQ